MTSDKLTDEELRKRRDDVITTVMQGNNDGKRLTEEDVILIKWALQEKPSYGLATKLAQIYNVTPEAISAIKLGTSWNWVKIPKNYNPLNKDNISYK